MPGLENSDEFKRASVAVAVLQAQFNDLACTLHQGIEILCLGMAAWQAGNCGDVKSILVAFDHYGEIARAFHKAILGCRLWQTGPAFGVLLPAFPDES